MPANTPMIVKLRRSNDIIVVPMYCVGFANFADKRAIGANGLNGCSVVIIAGLAGAIMAHIPPLAPEGPLRDSDRRGYDHVRRMMRQVADVLAKCRAAYLFDPADPANTVTKIIAKERDGLFCLEDQVRIMDDALWDLGLTPTLEGYYGLQTGATNFADGSVTVLSAPTDDTAPLGEKTPRLPNLFVEDRLNFW